MSEPDRCDIWLSGAGVYFNNDHVCALMNISYTGHLCGLELLLKIRDILREFGVFGCDALTDGQSRELDSQRLGAKHLFTGVGHQALHLGLRS